MSPPPGALLFRAPLYSHVITPSLRPRVCDHCLSRPSLWDHLPPAPALTRCARCKLPYYCGERCQRAAWKSGGHKAECKFLARVLPRVPPPLVLLLLRTLAREARDPSGEEVPGGGRRRLEDLVTHREEVQATEQRREAFSAFLPVFKACVAELYGREQLFLAYCRLIVNGTELTDAMGNSVGTALSLGLSALDHSCSPNCNVVFLGGGVEVRALPGLEVGWQEARINYVSTVLPREERRKILSSQYYFQCQCDLCSRENGHDLTAGAALCTSCKAAVSVSSENCGCGAPVAAEARIAGAFLGRTGLEAWRALSRTFHVLDWRMVEVGEGAMAEALEAGQFGVFLEVGARLMEAYRQHLHPYSLALGLHLAKLAKAAILLERREARDLLQEATDIFTLGLGLENPLVSYCHALRQTL